MLDASTRHPFVAATEFAIQWLGHIAAYDLAAAESMVDVNESELPFAQSFPAPEGFTYCHPDRARSLDLHFVGADDSGFSFDFDLPFAERHFRPMIAMFCMYRNGGTLTVHFIGIKPN